MGGGGNFKIAITVKYNIFNINLLTFCTESECGAGMEREEGLFHVQQA